MGVRGLLSGVVVLWAAGAMAQVTVPAPLDVIPLKGQISPPIIAGAGNCSKTDWRISLTGGVPGGTYEVFEALNPATFVSSVGVFPVAPNQDGVTVVDVTLSIGLPALVAMQTSPTGFMSPLSAPLDLRDPNKLGTPSFPFVPIWECGLATSVDGHQPGDTVELFSSQYGTRTVIPRAFGTSDYMPAGRPFESGEKIAVQYSTCEGQVSPLSSWVTVATNPLSPLGQPTIQSPSLAVGVERFSVEGVAHGATLWVALDRGGSVTKWREACATPVCTAYLRAALGGLQPGDRVEVSQELCRGSASASVSEDVKECGDTPLAEVAPPQPGDTIIRLLRYPLGATVRVFATQSQNPTVGLQLIGFAYDTNVVSLVRPIDRKDLWVIVAVDTPGCRARLASAFFVGR